MDSPKVSILIPTYNYAEFLDESIQSALSQTFTDFELIVVDNNSTDNTKDVVSKYLSDPRVSYHKNEYNIGAINNFNKCLEYTTAPYIKFLLADDILHPKQLSTFVEILEKNEKVVLVTSDSETFGAAKAVRKSAFEGLQDGRFIIQETIMRGKGNIIGEPTTVMFRAKTVAEAGKFSDKFVCLADLDYWFRLLTLGSCYFVPETLSYFRVHKKQMSFKENYSNWFDEYAFYKQIQDQNKYDISEKSLNLPYTVKRTALKSASAMYHLIPKLTEKKERKMFMDALKIAIDEKVVLKSIAAQIMKKRKKK